MRHDARYGTAIELLDRIFAGEAAEKVLTNWARANRYAGSKDRAAVRDIVFSVLRGKASYQAAGGGANGRAAVLGYVIAYGQDANAVFTGLRYAPAPLTDEERALLTRPAGADAPVYDVPEWLVDDLRQSLGLAFEATMTALRDRAPVDLRVNLLKSDVAQAAARLLQDGIATEPAPLATVGLRITNGERKLAQSSAYSDGLVELQDTGSQAVAEALPLKGSPTVLDYCAGGGGKSLAIASITGGRARITAFDASRSRLSGLPDRAARAGVAVTIADRDPVKDATRFDLVLLDVPCSGSGAWRRNPDARWKFTPDDLNRLTSVQDEILRSASGLVRDGGQLAYVTCSLLRAENEDRIAAFLADVPGWRVTTQLRLPLGPDSDGFFLSLLKNPRL